MAMLILLVEDDPNIGQGLKMHLELEDFEVLWAKDLSTARGLYETAKPALILLDLNLPDGHGLYFCKEIRKEDSETPILILTARVDEDSVIAGLDAGANDYIRKPCSSRELLARIRSYMRKISSQETRLIVGDLILNNEQRSVLYREQRIELNRREFDILQYMMQKVGGVVSREALLETINRGGEIFDRTIDSHVSHLRSRLKSAGITDVIISSVYGIGYRLEQK